MSTKRLLLLKQLKFNTGGVPISPVCLGLIILAWKAVGMAGGRRSNTSFWSGQGLVAPAKSAPVISAARRSPTVPGQDQFRPCSVTVCSLSPLTRKLHSIFWIKRCKSFEKRMRSKWTYLRSFLAQGLQAGQVCKVNSQVRSQNGLLERTVECRNDDFYKHLCCHLPRWSPGRPHTRRGTGSPVSYRR